VARPISTATAQEAMRVCRESARLVRMTGARAEHDSRRVRPGEEGELHREHVPRFRSRHQQDVGRPATAETMPF
jgi:hypothetical protein